MIVHRPSQKYSSINQYHLKKHNINGELISSQRKFVLPSREKVFCCKVLAMALQFYFSKDDLDNCSSYDGDHDGRFTYKKNHKPS